jgi:F1F0 ATPase subunit 2
MSASFLTLLGATLAGAVVGGLYLALLWAAVRRLAQGRAGMSAFVGLRLARAGLVLGALAAAAMLGVPAEGFVAALAGFVAVRVAATRLLGREAPGGAAWR